MTMTLLNAIAPEIQFQVEFRANKEFRAAFMRELATALDFDTNAPVMPEDLIYLLLTAETELMRGAMLKAASSASQ